MPAVNPKPRSSGPVVHVTACALLAAGNEIFLLCFLSSFRGDEGYNHLCHTRTRTLNTRANIYKYSKFTEQSSAVQEDGIIVQYSLSALLRHAALACRKPPNCLSEQTAHSNQKLSTPSPVVGQLCGQGTKATGAK